MAGREVRMPVAVAPAAMDQYASSRYLRCCFLCRFFSICLVLSFPPESPPPCDCWPPLWPAGCGATSMSLITTAIAISSLADLRADAQVHAAAYAKAAAVRAGVDRRRIQIDQLAGIEQPWIFNSIGRGDGLPAAIRAQPATRASRLAGGHVLQIRARGRFRHGSRSRRRASAPRDSRRIGRALGKFEFGDLLLGQRNPHACPQRTALGGE